MENLFAFSVARSSVEHGLKEALRDAGLPWASFRH
jgi:hypothetical protein